MHAHLYSALTSLSSYSFTLSLELIYRGSLNFLAQTYQYHIHDFFGTILNHPLHVNRNLSPSSRARKKHVSSIYCVGYSARNRKVCFGRRVIQLFSVLSLPQKCIPLKTLCIRSCRLCLKKLQYLQAFVFDRFCFCGIIKIRKSCFRNHFVQSLKRWLTNFRSYFTICEQQSLH